MARKRRPKLLDLFCGGGGAAMGYHRAGFDVVGVDVKAQKRYPFTFGRGDALAVLDNLAYLRRFDVIHASPPCQQFTPLRALSGNTYPDMVDAVRAKLMLWASNREGRLWAIENVVQAPIAHGIVLCGGMFGLRVYRHRRFELNVMIGQLEHPRHRKLCGEQGTKGGIRRKAHFEAGGNVTVCGNVGSYVGPAMGIDWMTGKELCQAIPPAYTEYIGRQLIMILENTRREVRQCKS